MMRILYSDKFIKSLPKYKDERKNIESRLKKIDFRYRECDETYLSLFSQGERSKLLEGNSGHFSFRLNNKDRIHYTLGKYISIPIDLESDDIVLLNYIKHDDINKAVKSSLDITLDEHFRTIGVDAIEVLDEPISKTFLSLNKLFYNSKICEDFVLTPCMRKNQYNCMSVEGASLIIGGAGSGKTLVLINKLCNISMIKNNRIAYFTYSDSLKSYCRQESEKISDVESVRFYTLNDFCIENLKLADADLFTINDFKNWLIKEFLVIEHISADEIWAEIRGCIKGYMGKNWQRTYSFEFDSIRDDRSKKYFISKKAIHEIDKRTLVNVLTIEELKATISDINDNINEKNKADKIRYLQITYDLSNKFKYDNDHRILDFDQYIQLTEEFSPYSTENRKQIYSIALKYQNYLASAGKYDDNDLSGLLIEKLLNNSISIEKFDHIFIDEVQDLTELQIFLVSKITQNMSNITYAGDIHQIINPTYFDINRLKGYYKRSGQNLNIANLDINFRSSSSIIRLANELRILRQEKIGAKKALTEQMLEGLEDFDTEEGIYKLKYTRDNINKILDSFKNNAGVVLLVADENEKSRILTDFDINEVDVFTVSEFKGLESEYVFCLDITSAFAEQWKNIIRGDASKDSKFRYFFNLFYVAITRAKTKLCICERDNVFKGCPRIENLLIEEEFFNEEKIGLNEPSTQEEWYESAEYYESKRKYDTAIRRYRKAGTFINDIDRCQAKKLWEEHKYEEAFRVFIRIKEFGLAKELALYCNDDAMNCALEIVDSKFSFSVIDGKYTTDVIAKAILLLENQTELLKTNYITPKIDRFIRSIKKVDAAIEEGCKHAQQ
jgi:superfamily I DNA/RNA helicase